MVLYGKIMTAISAIVVAIGTIMVVAGVIEMYKKGREVSI